MGHAFDLAQLVIFNFDASLVDMASVYKLIFFGWLIVLIQIFQYRKDDLLFILKQPAPVRALFYLICFYSLIFYGESDGKAFIYFQF